MTELKLMVNNAKRANATTIVYAIWKLRQTLKFKATTKES